MSPLLNLFSQGTIERLGWMLVHFLWQATAVALLLAVTLRALRRASASLRYAVSCATLALLVALPVVTMQLVEVSGPVAEAGPPPVRPPTAAATPSVIVEMVDEMPAFTDSLPLTAADLTIHISWQEKLTAGLESALPYVVLGWLVGVLGLSAWHLGGWAQLQQLKRRMVREAGMPLQDKLRRLVARLGVHQAVRLLESAVVEVPTVVGWLRPVILLPASALTGLNMDQLEAIIAHELAHVRRYDYLVNIVQTVVEILGFYHPAVWWVSHRIRVERENCCDDLAVRVCGSSLQYARALTTLEEIRHSWAELAVAATGGSLVARIARLLGRPAIDDRRFAWLPGLVALLLVAGLIIPTALVLGAPDVPLAAPRVDSEPNDSGQARDLPADEATPQTQAGQEQDLVQVLIKFSLFPEASADRVVDRETRNLLAGILAPEDLQALRETIHADPEQDVTLGEILRTWIAGRPMTPETLGVLIDVLQSRGYLGGEATPEVLANNNQQARMILGSEELILPPTDPASPTKPVRLGTFVQVTPHLSSLEGDRITLEVAAQWRERAKQDDPSSTPAVRTTEVASTLVIPSGQCAALVATDPGGPDVQLRVLLVGPASVIEPPPTTDKAPNASATTVVERPPQGDARRQDETAVLIDVVIAKVLSGATLDRETSLLIGAVLAVEAPPQETTLGDVLRRHVVGKLLAPATAEALMDLLQLRGYMEIQAKPSILTRDNVQAQVKMASEELVESRSDPNSPPQLIKLGTVVRATPHVPDPAGEHIRLELGVEFSERAPQMQPDAPPAVRTTEIASTVTALSNRCFSLLAEQNGGDETQAKDPESILVMIKPRIVKSAPGSANTPPAQQTEHRPRQVLVEVRTVALKAGQLAALGIEWSANSTNALTGGMWSPDSTNAPTSGIQVGYTPDRAFTDALLTTLRTLQEQNRAEILSSQQVVALDGSQSRIRAITQEWLSQAGLPKIDSGTVLSVTPRIGDADEITLEIEIQTSNALPRRQGSDLPIVTRRMAKSMVTLKDGGTAALAGLTGSPPGQSPQSTREIAILVTARLIPEDDPPTALPSAGPSDKNQLSGGAGPAASKAWTIMRQWNCPPLLLGLTQQFAKVLEPSRQNDAVWEPVGGGGALRLRVDMEGADGGDILVGLFADARWLQEPVAVRRIPRPGEYVLSGLPAGRYQVGAMVGEPPIARMLGVQRQWPQPVEIAQDRTATAEVLVSAAFQKHASGWYNEEVAADYLGRWVNLNEANLLQGRLTGPDGRPIRFGEIMIREHRTDERGFAAPNRGTNEQGLYKFDKMAWPYRVSAGWREPLPAQFGHRYQTVSLNRVLQGSQQVDFRFDPFPEGTAKLTGRVLDQNGRPVEGFFLRVLTASSEDLERQWKELDGQLHGYTGYDIPFVSQDGRFELGGLPEGAANVHVIPFESRRYERERPKDVSLTAGQTTNLDFRLPGKSVYYGRVLFKEGIPGAVLPGLWEGAVIRVLMTTGQRAMQVSEVDWDGYFTVYLDPQQREALAAGSSRLIISVPAFEQRKWNTAGMFPFEKLADDKSKAGTMTVDRPFPTIRLPELPPTAAENKVTVTARFEGTDLRLALQNLASLAGVPPMCITGVSPV